MRPSVAIGPRGRFAHVGVGFARRSTPARRRGRDVGRNSRARSMLRGCSPAPAFVRTCRLLGSLGSSRTACWGHQNRSWPSVASPSRRLAGHPKRRGFFAQSRRGMAHSAIWVTRSVRGERPEYFQVSGFGFCHRWRHLRAARRVIRASSPSSAFSVTKTNSNGPPNNKMEPTRLTVRAIMALRRAAHFERWADKQEPGIRINSRRTTIASGMPARRGHAPHIGVRLGRMDSVGRRRCRRVSRRPGQLAAPGRC